MKRIGVFGSAGLLGWTLAAVHAVSVHAQEPANVTAAVIAQPPNTAALGTLCQPLPEPSDSFVAQVLRARDLDTPEAVEAALLALEPEARRMAEEAPTDAAAQYRLAAVMGSRVDLEHGVSKVSGASELKDQVLRVLALEPNHPGANYMLGKIHASVLRLSGIKRFMAKTVLGGDAMKEASWEEARARLELAAGAEPCVPEHHFELARAYAAQKDADGWQRELAAVFALTEGGTSPRVAKLRERSDGFAQEWSRKNP